MKKMLGILLIFVMVISLGSVSAIDIVTMTSTKNLYNQSNSTYIEVTDSNVGAQYFKTEAPFTGFSVCCPSLGDNVGAITLSIYEWDTDYKTTLKGKPFAEGTFKDFKDNTWLSVNFFTRPAGEYMIVGSNGTGGVGMWIFTDGDPSTITYKNGEVVKNFYMQTRLFEVVDPAENNRKYEGKIDAYSQIDASMHTAGIGMKISKVQVFADKKQNVVAETQSGGYLLFREVDFGSEGAQGVELTVNAGQVADMGEFYVVLDDLSGDALAKVPFEAYNEMDEWQVVPATFDRKVTGVHNVYVVFKYEGSMFAYMQFTKEKPGLSDIEQRLADYKPVSDESLVDYMEDTWTATDAVGRSLGGYADYGNVKGNKEVMMFYHTWQINANSTSAPANVNEIVKNRPELKNDHSNPIWSTYSDGLGRGIAWHWNESLYGFYTGYDEWVMRKNLEMLTAAGVDAVVTDCSNGNRTFTPAYMRLAKTINEMRADGIDAPKISFLLPWASSSQAIESMERLYQSMYSTGLYSDTWYYVEGKPLLMGQPYSLTVATGNREVDERRTAMYDFFTFKENHATYKDGPISEKEWAWLSTAPQHGFGKGSKGTNPQMVAVSVAQNTNDESPTYTAMNGEGVYGRSYTYKDKHTKLDDTSAAYGYNFQEQWDYAVAMDPDYVFVTGWNEQIMIRYPEASGVRNGMVDLYNDEYSRDIEPTKSYMGDNYYYQLIDNVRRFKGVRETPIASAEKTISINGDFSQWNDVGPEFLAYKNNVGERNSLEYGYTKYYVNKSGRNDITMAKVARDRDNMYFYVETAENITPSTDKNWMRLLINTDRNYSTGWNGYDYIINRENPVDGKAVVSKYAGDYLWETAGQGNIKVEGNKLMISVPKALLGIEGSVDVEFKWADNTYSTTDCNDFYVNGDVAPLGRFNYRYTETTANDKKVEKVPLQVEETVQQKMRNSVVMKTNSPMALAKSTMVLLEADNPNITPKEINDRTLLPVRFLAESIGGKVSWSDISQTATLSFRGNVVKIKMGENEITVNNNKVIPIDVPAQTIDDRTFVPMRAICEALGLYVHWDSSGVIVAGEDSEQFCKDTAFMQSLVNIAQEW